MNEEKQRELIEEGKKIEKEVEDEPDPTPYVDKDALYQKIIQELKDKGIYHEETPVK
jgi:hypothetical protein